MKDKIKVYQAIKNAPRTGNVTTITYKKIAEVTGVQITMVSSCIRFLVDRGYVEKISNFGPTGGAKANGYKIRKLLEDGANQ